MREADKKYAQRDRDRESQELRGAEKKIGTETDKD